MRSLSVLEGTTAQGRADSRCAHLKEHQPEDCTKALNDCGTNCTAPRHLHISRTGFDGLAGGTRNIARPLERVGGRCRSLTGEGHRKLPTTTGCSHNI